MKNNIPLNKKEIKATIEFMNKNNYTAGGFSKGLYVFRFSNPKIPSAPPTYYAFKILQNFLIGEGAFGKIYKAYAINPKTYEFIRDKFVVVKETIRSSEDDNKEYNISSKFMGIPAPIVIGEYQYVVQPYMGKSMKNNAEIDKLPPKALLSLIKNLVYKMNTLHHACLSSGIAIVHGDVKLENILVNFTYDAKSELKAIDVNFIDFGLSESLTQKIYHNEEKIYIPNDDPKKLYLFSVKGNDYFPPETKGGIIKKINLIGIKSDIYQLAAVIAELLGCRDQPDDFFITCFETSFTLDNLSKLQEFKFGEKVNKLVVDFINRMRNEEYQKRPDSDETCKFFFTLSKLQKTNNQECISQIIETLSKLAYGNWSQEQEKEFKKLPDEDKETKLSKPLAQSSQSETGESHSIRKNIYTTFKSQTTVSTRDTPTGTEAVDRIGDIICLQ